MHKLCCVLLLQFCFPRGIFDLYNLVTRLCKGVCIYYFNVSTSILFIDARPYPIFGSESYYGSVDEAGLVLENFTCLSDDSYYNIYDCQRNSTRYSATGCNGVDTVLTCVEGKLQYIY